MVRNVLWGAGGVVFVLAVAWPTLALVARCVADGQPPVDGFIITPRQWTLLVKSAALAVAAAAAAVAISIPGAYVIGSLGSGGGRPHRPALAALLVAGLLFPPMVYVFGWQRLLPKGVPDEVQCVGIWALWAYPIPALLLGAGWSRLGRAAYHAALLDMAPAAAFCRVAVPMLAPYGLAALLILFVIFLGEYSVPHACSVLVYATELLGWSDQSPRVIDALWPSLPLVGLILAAALAAAWAWGRRAPERAADAADVPKGTAPVLTVLAALGCIASPVIPLVVLGVRLESPGVMAEALRTYGTELLQSLAVAGLSGILVAGMGVCVVARPRLRRPAVIWALAFGALPGALVGEAVLAAYQRIPMLYENWPLVVLGYTARFAWIGVLAMWLASRAGGEDLAAQARTDGADEVGVAWRIHAAASWPILLFGACLAAAMALAELPASTLVRVPSVGLIAHVLVEKFHRFEEGMLIALSLWLAAAALPAAVLLAVIFHRQHPDFLRRNA